jgi:hypothetical protein
LKNWSRTEDGSFKNVMVGDAKDKKGKKASIFNFLFFFPYGSQKAKGTDRKGERTFMQFLERKKCLKRENHLKLYIYKRKKATAQ